MMLCVPKPQHRKYPTKWMTLSAVGLVIVGALLAVSYFDKSASEREEKREAAENRIGAGEASKESDEEEDEEKPDVGDVGEDCVAFVLATKTPATQPAAADNASCPTCPPTGDATEVLRVEDVKVDRITPTNGACQVAVRIFARFNPSHGGSIVGGLTGWITPEQREQYARGETPEGQQIYHVNITYRRNANGWQPIEFSR